MGNRVTVSISGKDHETPVNVYSHWAGDEVYAIVQDVLETSDRIGDGSYLTAQIIHAIFTELAYDGKLSFGVWAGELGESWDDNDPMFVDTDNGKWRIGNGEMDWQDRGTRVQDVLEAACDECGDVGVVSYDDKDGEALGEPCPSCKEGN
jgi:hypothetical protein